MEAPDFEMRCRICSRRAQCMKLTLSQEVIEYIAGSITTNVRELEGALLKMAAFESLSGQPITLSAARQILAEHVVRMDPVVQNSEILSAAADLFGVSVSDMYSAKKDRTTTLARSAAMYLTRRFTKMSFPEIGRAFGNKNHATVILACRKIDQALAAGKTFKWQTKGGWQSMAAKEVLDALIEKIS